MTTPRLRWTLIATAVAAAVTGPALGAPGDRTTTLLAPAAVASGVDFLGATADGQRVWLGTAEALTGSDTDALLDVYERRPDGSLTLLTPGTATHDATFAGASADGSTVWFETDAAALPADTDVTQDVYEVTGGAVSLVTTGQSPAGEGFVKGAPDGTRVWFRTDVAYDAANDPGNLEDVYERPRGAAPRLVTAGGATVSDYRGAADDGGRAWFLSFDPIDPSATPAVDPELDGAFGDVFERLPNGTVRQVSLNTPNQQVVFAGASADGARVRFETAQALLPEDTDAVTDLYEAGPGGLRRISAGANGSGAFEVGATPSGDRVWFQTTRRVDASDTDTATDIYERDLAGTVTKVSAGNGNESAFFLGASADGTRVLYQTAEALVPGDTNFSPDIYQRTPAGGLRLVTPGTQLAPPDFGGASADGQRVWFRSPQALVPADTDVFADVYERTPAGDLVLASPDTPDDVFLFLPPGSGVAVVPSTADGSRIWLLTPGAVPGTGDTDALSDVYERAWGVPAVTVPPAVTGAAGVGQPLTCGGETVAGEGVAVTRQWLRGGSPVPGATAATFTPAPSDAGAQVACRVTATNPIGAASADSAAVTIPAPPAATPQPPAAAGSRAPRITSAARITGAPIRGTRLQCAAAVADATSRTVQWRRGATVVGRSTAYTVAAGDLGRKLTCTVKAAGPGGDAASTSPALTVPARCVVPRLRGLTAAAARDRLAARGCRAKVVTVATRGGARSRVAATTPGPRASRPNGATVTVRVRR